MGHQPRGLLRDNLSKTSTLVVVVELLSFVNSFGTTVDFPVVPWNVFAFFVGIILWFAVGVMWKDRAIMVVHVGAFISLVAGYLSAS